MRAAQKLYEAGHITYMRTDSPNLSQASMTMITAFIKNEFGQNYLENRVYKSKSKNAQEAHEAVRPTDITKVSAGKNEDEQRLYSLIWKRTLSSQMKAAQTIRTKISASNSDDIKDFSLSGSRLKFDG
jgi:DNA topoisomerase-1